MTTKRKILVSAAALVIASAAVYYFFFRPSVLSRDLDRALKYGSDFKLLSIDPAHDFKDDPPRIAGFKVLGETPIISRDEQSAVLAEFKKAVANWDGGQMACFDPRHDIRFMSAGKLYDILICFECQYYLVFCDGNSIGSGRLTGNGAAMNAILKKANVPLPAQE